MLHKLGSKVAGFGLKPDSTSLFELLDIEKKCKSHLANICNLQKLQEVTHQFEPEIVIHMAAQAMVRESYQNPIENYSTNLMGTVNMMEIVRQSNSIKAVVNVTTDKCYENKEQRWAYRENDPLGGHDPYSASKACSEIITQSYHLSFIQDLGIGLATARGGNVIGGGDFSKDRIIPDIFRSIQANQPVLLRNPKAIRPWQHILDVLSGYLKLSELLYNSPEKYSQAYNFSPLLMEEVSVENITQKFIQTLNKGSYTIDHRKHPHEANLLKLDPTKAYQELAWSPKFNVRQAVEKTAIWYENYLRNQDIVKFSNQEVEEYLDEYE